MAVNNVEICSSLVQILLDVVLKVAMAYHQLSTGYTSKWRTSPNLANLVHALTSFVHTAFHYTG